MRTIAEQFYDYGVVPVVVLNETADALPLARALTEGGLPCAEVTFRTEAAEESIRLMSCEYPDMLVGAGTVLTVEQADRAVAAGAKFIVSPGFNSEVVAHCAERDVLIIPGCSNPSDIERAITYDLKAVKFFPAEAAGGLKMIKAMAAPYKMIKFMPTGGINVNNMNQYLAYDRIIACGGSWMVKEALIKAQKFDEIAVLVKKAMITMLGFELQHVGINSGNEQEARNIVQAFEMIFGFEKKDGNSSIFAGNGIEAMKTSCRGTNGHLAIGTNDILRAIAYFERQNIEIDMDTAKYKDGKFAAVYMKEEIGGFAIHLLQKQEV